MAEFTSEELFGKLGFMQGRLSDLVDGKIQAFPIKDWKSEFFVAAENNYRILEWTLDFHGLYDNPLMTPVGRREMLELSQKYNLTIPSVTGDCFMQAPFWKAAKADQYDLKIMFLDVCQAAAEMSLRSIVLPLVDQGSLDNPDQEKCLIEFLVSQSEFLTNNKLEILFESDFNPQRLAQFISHFPSVCFGINYDMGNSAGLGYQTELEFDCYFHRISNVHIKDRIFGGSTVPLGEGAVNFEQVINGLLGRSYKHNFILQTARSSTGKHVEDLNKYRDFFFSLLLAQIEH